MLANLILLTGLIITAEPTDARTLAEQAQAHSTAGRHAEAIADLTKLIELAPETIDVSRVHDFRGSERLLDGKFSEAIDDFDRYLAAHPDQAPYHWKRGIALYYAGRFADGVKQFDLHQTVNSADVENAVWRYLCMARIDGVAKAEKDLLKVGPDSRVPMHEVFELYAGRATPDDVLKAADAGDPGDDELKTRRFYAHLYLGLHADVGGKPDAAREHMKQAVEKYLVDHYMGGIAVVHLRTLEQPKK